MFCIEKCEGMGGGWGLGGCNTYIQDICISIDFNHFHSFLSGCTTVGLDTPSFFSIYNVVNTEKKNLQTCLSEDSYFKVNQAVSRAYLLHA